MTTNKLKILSFDKAETQERKRYLRAYIKTKRTDNVNRDVKEQLLLENFFKWLSRFSSETDRAGMRRNVFVYMNFSSEAPTDALIKLLKEAGYRVFCPRVEGREMVAVPHSENIALSPMRIREPIGQAFEGDIHLIIAPLLAVDEQGNRLGYGGGYYDRFFKRHENAVKIGYAYDFQVVRNVPKEEHDISLDYTITDERILRHKYD